MTATHYVVAKSPAIAERHAAHDPRCWFKDKQSAFDWFDSLTPEARAGFAVYEVAPFTSHDGRTVTARLVGALAKAAAVIAMIALALAFWIITPGEAFAAFKEPPLVARTWADDFAALVAVLIGFAGFGLAAIAVAANWMRDKARDFYGENYDGE